MKTLVSILFIFFSIGIVSAQEGAGMKFEETSFNFGEIEYNSEAQHSFKFTNTGSKPLIIRNVRPSCGCTTPEWPKNPIMPGETGEIKATYDTKREGRFHKSITVLTNIEENGTKILYIKGVVLPKGQDAEGDAKSPVRLSDD